MAAPFTPTVVVEAGFGNGPGDGTITWTDLTSYRPAGLNIGRGRPSELQRFTVGSCSLTLTDPDRDLDPTNLSGPYVGTVTAPSEFPLYVGSVATEAGTSLGTDNAQTNPTGVTVGELLLAYVAVDLNGGATGVSLGTGSAVWTELFDDANGTSVRHALYARIATGSDALVLTGSSEDYVVEIIRVGRHGCATTADIEVGTTATGTSGTPNPPALAAGSTQKWLWLGMVGVDTTNTTVFDTYPTGMTRIDEEISAVSTTSVGLAWAYVEEEGSSYNPLNWGINNSRAWVANTIAIPPEVVTADRSQVVTGTPIRVVATMADDDTVLDDTAAGPGLHSGWRVVEGAVTAAISGAYTIPIGTVLESSKAYNFDGPASFQFGTAADGASPFHDVLIVLANQGFIGWTLNATTLTYQVNDGSVTVDDTVTWNDTNHRYLRISFDGDDILFERSANASSWTTIDTYTRGTDFDASVDWSYGHLRIANASASTTPQFDDFIVTASHHTLFTGTVDSWDWRPLPGKPAGTVDVRASDAFARLAQIEAPSIWQETVRSHTPLVWYQLSETTGITVSDSSGNGYHGTAPYVGIELGVDPPSPRVGGSAVRFPERNTVNGIYVPPDARVTSIPYTWAAWVQASVAFPNQAADAFDNLKAMVIYTQADTGDSFTLQVAAKARSDINETDINNPVVAGWVVSIVSENPTDGLTVVDYTATLEDTLPHHLAWVVDSSGNGALYIDGQPAAVYETFAGFAGTMLGTFIGNDWTQPGSPNAYSFPGTVDEVMVLPDDLSAAQVLDLYQAGWAPGDGDTTGERVERLLDLVGWPAALRLIDRGEVTMGPADLSGSVLSCLQDVERTEGGRLFIGPHGEVVFHDRGRCDTRSSSPVLYDTAGSGVDLLVDGFSVVADDSFVFTSASVTRPGGSPQVYVDDTAVDRFGTLTYSDTLLTRTDQEAYSRAVGMVGRYKEPLPRFGGWTVAPEKDPTLWWQVLDAWPGDTVRLTFQLLGAGDSFDDYLDLASTAVDIAGGGWTVTMTGTPQDPSLDLFFQFDASDDVGFNFGLWR